MRDDGTIWALGAVAALTGLAWIGVFRGARRQGSSADVCEQWCVDCAAPMKVVDGIWTCPVCDIDDPAIQPLGRRFLVSGRRRWRVYQEVKRAAGWRFKPEPLFDLDLNEARRWVLEAPRVLNVEQVFDLLDKYDPKALEPILIDELVETWAADNPHADTATVLAKTYEAC